MDPQELITRFLDTTRPVATRAADVEAIKNLLVGLSTSHPMGLQAVDALRQVFLDPTEAAEVRQAVTQAIDELPHQWYYVIGQQVQRQVGIPLQGEVQLQRNLAHLQHEMTVSRLLYVWNFAYLRDPRVLAILAEAASHPDPAIRAAAQGYLVDHGEPGTVVQALHDAAPIVRAAAAETLGYQGSGNLSVEDLKTLEGGLADPDQEVREAVQVALRRLGVRPLPPPPLAPPVVSAPPAGTTRFAWAPFLAEWSWRLVQLEEVREDLPEAVIASSWLGYPGATDAQLAVAEQRLGRRLPPSYREFLQVTNGWRLPWMTISRLLPIEEVDLFQAKDPNAAEGWAESQVSPSWVKYPDQEEFVLQTPEDLSEAAHRVYGAEQDPLHFRGAYVRSTLQISEPSQWAGGVDTYLLNPEVVTPEGEWEAWLLSSNLLGAQRWPSFWEMVQEEARTQFPGGPPSDAAAGQEGSLPPEE